MNRQLQENSFNIRLHVSYHAEPIHFVAKYFISGEQNKIRFEMQGTAQSIFMKNRIGICVLHPIAECAGHKAKVIHPDGDISNFIFSQQIAAHPIVQNIESMQWSPAKGLTAMLNFSGDVFEMEDQRNWTDASFKTYCSASIWSQPPMKLSLLMVFCLHLSMVASRRFSLQAGL